MQNRKEQIMDMAEYLFNEKGYNFVSLRDIADALQISKGNLTYHFQKKEDLIEACILRNHENYKKPPIPQSMRELNDFFCMLISKKANRPYYFRNYAQLADVCPKVYMIQHSVIEDFADVIETAIRNLSEAGLFRTDCLDVYHGIVQCILAVLTYGVPATQDQTDEDQRNCIWCTLLPCLTKEGLAEYHALPKR